MAEDTASGESNNADPDDPAELEAVADRLEAALDRIVRHLETARPTVELTARLDGLIGRLRDALGSPVGSSGPD
jgi:hypothetical protein